MTVKRKNNLRKVALIAGVIVLAAGLTIAYSWYKRFFGPSVTEAADYLYLPTGSDFEAVIRIIGDEGIIKDTAAFRWAAEKMDYPPRVKSGKYRLSPGMNNRGLINMLGGGFQEPVQLRFQNIRLKEDFAGFLSTQLEPDSITLVNLMNSDSLAARYGFDTDNFFSMFIPNTYEFFWDTKAEDFFSRMHKEYEKFWTEERRKKAEQMNLSLQEISVLAAIVKGEAMHTDEMPVIAGLYLNRLKRGMLLQADPTVIFATGDFTIRRVLYRHLRTDSPYNTYLYKGLPPGPIMMPSIASIDAVLNYEQHQYIYMCAKDDFSGYHNFARTQAEHMVNARKFQQALNERNIKR